jgi:hypothetical protein
MCLKGVVERKGAAEWVGARMKAHDKLLLFARHGVEHPPTRQYEEELRKKSLQDNEQGAQCRELLKRVDEARATFNENKARRLETERNTAHTIRMLNREKVGDLQVTSDRVLEALAAWGYDGDLSTIVPQKFLEQLPLKDWGEDDSVKLKARKKKPVLRIQDTEVLSPTPLSQVSSQALVAVVPTEEQGAPSCSVDPPTADLPPVQSLLEAVKGVNPIPGVSFDFIPRKRRRTTRGETSAVEDVPSSSAPADKVHVCGRVDLPLDASVLDLEVACKLREYVTLPADMQIVGDMPPEEMRDLLTAHTLTVSFSSYFSCFVVEVDVEVFCFSFF